MKLARREEGEPFYDIVIDRAVGPEQEPAGELFDFNIAIPNDLRLHMPLSHLEFLPVLTQMLRRPGLMARAKARLENAPPEELHTFRRLLAGQKLLAPVDPPSIRAFDTFATHVHKMRARRGLYLPAEWYQAPAFVFAHTASMVAPNEAVRMPPDTQELDFAFGLAAIIGKTGRDIAVEDADSYIAGFTICNDWTLRDVERQEWKLGAGPSKSKDFATSLGPYLVTPEELADRLIVETDVETQPNGKRYDLVMTARVNGREIGRGNARDMQWTWAELIAHASRNSVLHPGDVLLSGTVGSGCLAEFPAGTFPFLRPGDVVCLEVDHLGTLENTIVI